MTHMCIIQYMPLHKCKTPIIQSCISNIHNVSLHLNTIQTDTAFLKHHMTEKQTLSMTWCTFELTRCKRVKCDCLRVCHTYNFSIFLHPSSSYLGSNELCSDSWVPCRPWTLVGGRRNSWFIQMMKENMFVWYPLYQLSISRSVGHW